MPENQLNLDEHPLIERDALDFRDRLYRPNLKPLPPFRLPKPEFINIRDQQFEGSCTGFGLAAVIDYLAAEQAGHSENAPDFEPVSARMLYEMAKTHDRWPGSDYQGSSARASMKGWHKNGVCRESTWPYLPGRPGELDHDAQQDALARPLGAYYRVLPKRADLFAALTEVSAIFVTARIHEGWYDVTRGTIPFDGRQAPRGGHAFAVIGYTEDGFIVQNSWGADWGGLSLEGRTVDGVAIWRYEDFEQNLWDAWVARTALPVESLAYMDPGRYIDGARGPEARERAPARSEIQHHYIHVDDGQLDPRGDYPSSNRQVEEILEKAFDGTCNHLFLYAHGGLNSVKGSASRVASWRPVFRENGIYEIHFIWETGFWEELRDVLFGKETFARERAGGVTGWTDLWIEHLAHRPGHALWMEMLSDADLAFASERAGTRVIEGIVERLKSMDPVERPAIHFAGHSAGSIWMGHLLNRWRMLDAPSVENLMLFAPACTGEFYEKNIRSSLTRRKADVKKLHHFLLDDRRERDDHVGYIYRKSLLYLVSRSFQKKNEVVPLMGLEKHWKSLVDQGPKSRIREYVSPHEHSKSASHGGFDNDAPTMNALLEIILDRVPDRPFSDRDLEGY